MKTIVKVPEQIQVGEHTYNVFYKPFLSKDNGHRGVLNNRKEAIYIEPENPVTQRNATMLHEIVHFIEMVFALDLTDADVDRVSEGLLQVLSSSFGIEFDWSDIKAVDERESN